MSRLRLLTPKIWSGDFHCAAHLEKSRAHPFTDSISQGFFSSHGPPSVWQQSFFLFSRVKVVGRNDSAARVAQITRTFDIPGGENISDSVPNPVRRFDTSKIVNHKNLDSENGSEETNLSRFGLLAIAFLDFSYQFALFAHLPTV